MIHNVRKLNDITVKNKYPLPLIEAILDQIQGAKYFTKLDVRWGYHNICIKEGNEWKAAFITPDGLYEPTVMMFGLCNAPATFQGFMNHIFADLVARRKVAVYLDDVLIFASDINKHCEIVKEVLKRMEDNNLYLRPTKCKFEKTETEYLRVVIKDGQICMDLAKVAGTVAWEAPKTVKAVRSFLGFANYYRRFIQGYASIVRPLNDLTKKDTKWIWGDKEQTAFQTLKDTFMTEPVLAQWESGKPVQIETDASNYAMGAVHSQQKDNSLWHPIAFRSTSMTKAKRNYQIYDKEMLAIIRATEDWRHYLEDQDTPFEILTDHNNLKWWTNAQDLMRRQARWALWLSRFNFILKHKPSAQNNRADALSCMDHHKVPDVEDNRQVTVLGPEHFATVAYAGLKASVEGTALEDEICGASEKEAEVIKALEQICKTGARQLANGVAEWEEEDGLVYYKGCLYIPQDNRLRQKVLQQCHDAITVGHPGRSGTLELVSRYYWWPGMTAFVNKYVDGCDSCTRNKAAKHPRATLEPHDVPEGPWQVVTALDD
jgi:hypothetical protein